jgi:hypothetical protein
MSSPADSFLWIGPSVGLWTTPSDAAPVELHEQSGDGQD